MNDFSVNIDEPFLIFQNHIEIDGNNRILFSGKFGSGKTFFLTEYFTKHSNKYSPFWLVPVDYSVSNNEDIFEYIKVDISKQLLPKLPQNVQEKFSDLLYIQQFVIHSPLKIISSLLSTVKLKIFPNPIAEIEIDFKEGIEKLSEGYRDFKKAIEDESKGTLTKNIETQLEKKGSIYEDDIVTQTIRSSIKFLKNRNKKKQSVLIIDDLDRLDPEHIFRILNILSAHNNRGSDENKFGFDKIIIVCDNENIKKIFEHKYGEKVDFNGYIDKFYAHSIYHFSNEEGIKLFCNKKFRSDLDDNEILILTATFIQFYQKGVLTLRQLRKITYNTKIHNTEIIEKFVKINERLIHPNAVRPLVKDNDIKLNISDFKILRVIQILHCVIGDFNGLKTILEELKNTTISINQIKCNNLYNCFGLLHHFCLNVNDSKLFYEYRGGSAGEISHYSYPRYRNSLIKLPWFYHTSKRDYEEYTLSDSYFKNAEFEIIKDDNYNVENIISLDIYKILHDIVSFINGDKRFATAIGVTS